MEDIYTDRDLNYKWSMDMKLQWRKENDVMMDKCMDGQNNGNRTKLAEKY